MVGGDVRDDRGVRAVDEEGAVALVGLGHEEVAGAGSALWPVAASTPPTAYVGSAPAATSAEVSSEVVVVLPWVPATATTRRPAITDHSPAERGRIRSPRRRPSSDLGVVVARRRGDDEGVGVADVLGGVAEVARRRRARAAPARNGVSLSSLPVTGRPRAP